MESDRLGFDPVKGELLVSGGQIIVPGRASEIFRLLVEARGGLVTKDEIISRVWPGAAVADNNLQVHISSIRKALGQERHLIKTVSGRGYKLSGNWAIHARVQNDAPIKSNLPAQRCELIGREAELREIDAILSARRIVTLAGPGGIGKTRLAIEAARRLQSKFADGAWFVSLETATDDLSLLRTVVSAVGLTFAGGSLSMEGIARATLGRRMLMVFDGCEHIIDAAAILVNVLARANPDIAIVATSREPLWAEGEVLRKVPPLELPRADDDPPDVIAESSAVRLFLGRVRALEPHFPFNHRSATAISAICRQLDGIPLAIELAAARAAALGLDALASGLERRFDVLTHGNRAALPRHQTLRATLDWSYDLLSQPERKVLQALSSFKGSFTLESAIAVAPEEDVLVVLPNLVLKSLVVADTSVERTRYRLLETTRNYAFEKLRQSTEHDKVLQRHAEYFCELAARTAESSSSLEWIDRLYSDIENIRAAMDWCFEEKSRNALGIGLVANTTRLYLEKSLLEECRRRISQALAGLRNSKNVNKAHVMLLYAAQCTSIIYASGPTTEAIQTCKKLLSIASELRHIGYQARAVWGLWTAHIYGGRPKEALELCTKFQRLVRLGLNGDRLIGRRIRGVTLHYCGKLAEAQSELEEVVASFGQVSSGSTAAGYSVDQGLLARAVLSRVYWLRGRPLQAFEFSEEALRIGRAGAHVMSRCYVLVQAGIILPIAVGKLDLARDRLEELVAESRRHDLPVWKPWTKCYEARIQIAQGLLHEGAQSLKLALDELRKTTYTGPYTILLAKLAETCHLIGREREGLRTIDKALKRATVNQEGWCLAEILRVRGELLSQSAGPERLSEAEAALKNAMKVARSQDAKTWELRAATSLAKFRLKHGGSNDIREMLQRVINSMPEQNDTRDLRLAQQIVQSAT